MASTLDTSTLTSSAQIFSAKHTLPQIRSIHSQLRAEIEDKSSRLRNQVGGSYRELLGTADAIVRMRDDTGRVQDLLAGMGGRCGQSVVSSKATGLAGFFSGDRDPDTGRAVRWKLLDACLLLVGRILRGQGGALDGGAPDGGAPDDGAKPGQRLVLATKVWVLGRLLIKSLGEEEAASVEGSFARRLEESRKSIGSLRRRLLGCVRKALDRVDDGTESSDDVLEPLCAYSLVTSSGARDVLRHFLSVRGEAMTLAFARDEGWPLTTADDVIRSLTLYTRTILEVQAMVPAKLSPALAGLKSRPLLADAHLQRLEGLQLDVCQQWCGEEMQLFTPFVRHDDLAGQQARDMLAGWAARAGQVNLEGLRKTVERMTEPKAIIDLRTKVLQLWIRDGARAKGFNPVEMQDKLREVINARMLAVLEANVAKLRLVGSEVEATLDAWQEGVTDQMPDLWDEDGYDEALDNGAVPFVQEVANRLHGRSDAVSRAVHRYSSWLQIVDGVRDALERLKKQRWENDYDEIEDEETIEARQQALSRDDPRKLQEKLDASLDAAFGDLEGQLGKLWDKKSGGPTSGAMAMYLIRVLRDMRAHLPERPAVEDFGLALVPSLHGSVVAHVSAPALDDAAAAWLPDRKAAGKPLWEGEPALPSQSSYGVFRFLQKLSLAMADAGVDLWGDVAVAALKKHLCGRLLGRWREELAELSSGDAGGGPGQGEPGQSKPSQDEPGQDEPGQSEPEGEPSQDEPGQGESSGEGNKEMMEGAQDEVTGPDTDGNRDVAIQWLFDVSYLLCCVGNVSGTASQDLKSLQDEIYEQTGLDDPSRLRITKAAQDYWQRTSLLFGLLA